MSFLVVGFNNLKNRKAIFDVLFIEKKFLGQLRIMSAPSSSSKPSENEQIKVSVQMPDVKSQKKGRKHQMIYYISDEDIRHLKKKTRFTEGDLR